VRQDVERFTQIVHDFIELVSSFLARCIGSQISNRRLQSVDSTIQLWLRIRRCAGPNLFDQSFQLATTERNTKKLNGKIRHLVGLIQNYCFCPWQKLNESFFFHGQVGKQQMMIDDHQVRFLCGLARLNDVAPGILRTFLAQAIFSG